jgi:hypothetical protein
MFISYDFWILIDIGMVTGCCAVSCFVVLYGRSVGPKVGERTSSLLIEG